MEVVLYSSNLPQQQTQHMESGKILNDQCCGNLESTCVTSSVFSRDIQESLFLAGFRDCRQEVLRYLADNEQLSLEGSIILGLEQHLTKLESSMQTFFKYNDHSCDYVCNGGNYVHEQYSSTSFSSGGEIFQGKRPIDTTSLQHDISDGQSREEESVGFNVEKNRSFDSGCDSSSLVISSANSSLVTDTSECAVIMSPETTVTDGDTNVNSYETTTESELAQNALELMHLAHNNPSINRILNELFVLMDDDYVTTDDDDDDGVEVDDDEIEEMISESLDDC